MSLAYSQCVWALAKEMCPTPMILPAWWKDDVVMLQATLQSTEQRIEHVCAVDTALGLLLQRVTDEWLQSAEPARLTN